MTYLYRTRWLLLIILIALAPFHAFLIIWAKDLSGEGANGVVGILSVWREVFAAAICGIIVLELAIQRRLPRFDRLDLLIVIYFILALVWMPFQFNNLAQWALGVRFDVMPFLFLLFIRQVDWANKKWLVRAFFISATIVIAFGLFHALVLPRDFLTHFGYPVYNTTVGAENNITACQYLEHTTTVCRATSTFGGPTRYGVYLLLVLGMLVPFLMEKNRWRLFAGGLFALTLVSTVLTYSRSVWVGLVAMAIFALFWLAYTKEQHRKKIVVAAICVLGLTLIAAGIFAWRFSLEEKNNYVPQLAHSIFVRTASSNAHLEFAEKGLKVMAAHPLGIGLGKVGPASVRFGEKFLTENWYLQIGAETGLVGLLIFLGILFLISRRLLAQKTDWRKIGLFLCLLGIAVTGFFTHSFEETSAVLMLFAFLGIKS